MGRLLPLALALLTGLACTAGEEGPAPGEWVVSEHPCFGNRTDAVAIGHGAAWVGCGSTTSGTGLFVSEDGGASWEVPATSPTDAFGTFRVSSLQLASDGWLYVGGIAVEGDDRVVRLDPSRSPHPVEDVLAASGQTWNNFQVGTFRRTDDGLSVAESLTGGGIAVRYGDDGAWGDGSGWSTEGNSPQILDLATWGGEIVGAGSTISEPPTIFVPADDASPTRFRLTPVQPAPERKGELWGVATDATGTVAGGVDQVQDVGLIYTATGRPSDPSAWRETRVDEVLIGSDATWIRGVCRDGDRVVAVGEHSRESVGIVLWSDDGGASFVDVAPSEPLPVVSRCVFDGDDVVVAGAEGLWAALGG